MGSVTELETPKTHSLLFLFLSFRPVQLLGFRQKKAINQSLHKTLIRSPRLSQKINLEKPMPSTSLANGSVNGNAGDRPPDVVADDKPGVSMMEQLVPEITTHALSYLDYPSLCRLSMTNSLMRKAANDDNAWKALFHKDFTLEQDGITPVNGWKAYYATTRAIISVNTGFFDIIRERSLPDMAQLWLNSDYVKCIHASGELFSGYSEVMQSWQLCFNWEQGFDFQVHNVRTRILTDMAWVTMKAYLNVDAGPFLITNVFEHHNGRWHMVHHHSSVMLIDGVNQQVVVH